MMEAKDTVKWLKSDNFKALKLYDPSVATLIEGLLPAQAEISFKAGIQVVVKWLEEHSAIGEGDYTEERCQLYQEWQAKLKEWGIE